MAKLLKLRRGTTSQHSSFTGAEGEVTIDTTKDTAVVHDGTTQAGRPLAREDMSNVSSASIAGQLGTDSIATSKIAGGALPTDVTVTGDNIVNGTITNNDIYSGAAIAGTKISPDFGSQDITTTGTLKFANVYSTTGNLPSASTYHGMFAHVHNTGAAYFSHAGDWYRLVHRDSNGDIDHPNDLDVGGALTVTGNVSGASFTVNDNAPQIALLDNNNNSDFRIKVDGGNFQIEDVTNSGADRFVIASDSTTTIAGNLDCSSGVDVTGNITVTGTVDGRDVAADGSKLDGIESGATADQSASEILTLIKTVDGSGSGLDADTLDGAQPSDSAGNNTIVKRNSSGYIFSNFINTTDNSVSSGVTAVMVKTGSDYHRSGNAAAVRSFLNVENGATADQSASEILTLIKTVDGGGSGLDADFIDGISSGDLLKSNTADTAYGDITFDGGSGAVTISANSDIRLTNGNWTGNGGGAKIQGHNSSLYLVYPDAGSCFIRDDAGNNNFTVDSSGNCTAAGNVTAFSDARLKTEIHTINDALGICGKLRGVNYKWLADGKPSIGVIAQEVEEVVPEVVLTNQDVNPVTQEITEVKSVDYGKLVGVLINAVNELKAELDAHKAECAKQHG